MREEAILAFAGCALPRSLCPQCRSLQNLCPPWLSRSMREMRSRAAGSDDGRELTPWFSCFDDQKTCTAWPALSLHGILSHATSASMAPRRRLAPTPSACEPDLVEQGEPRVGSRVDERIVSRLDVVGASGLTTCPSYCLLYMLSAKMLPVRLLRPLPRLRPAMPAHVRFFNASSPPSREANKASEERTVPTTRDAPANSRAEASEVHCAIRETCARSGRMRSR